MGNKTLLGHATANENYLKENVETEDFSSDRIDKTLFLYYMNPPIVLLFPF
jgi:hypothetical protein